MSISGDLYSFTDTNLEKVPDTAGVYALYQGGALTYIGRAKGDSTTIRSRLKDHKSGREGRCTQQADQYRRESCTNPVARERELLLEYQNQRSRLPRCNSLMP